MLNTVDAQKGRSGEAAGNQPMTEAERTRVLYEWNDTQVPIPEVCAHELFEQQAERTPEAIAVVCGTRQLSYGELNKQANQLAHVLRKRGVRRETLVGICLPRTP